MSGEILVPIGGTADSVVALPTALTFASLLDAGVHLVRVLPAPTGPLAGTASALGADRAAAAVRARVDEALATIADEITASGLQGSVSVLEGGDVAGLLLKEARARPTRMIVMASHPRGIMERALLGGVADRVIRESGLPVVIVPVRAQSEDRVMALAAKTGVGLVRAALRAARPMRRILVPIDGAPGALRALSALRPAAGTAEEVLLLHVVVPAVPEGVADTVSTADGRSLASGMREARERLEELARQQLRIATSAPRTEVVKADDPAEAIAAAARDQGADLIAMSTRAERGLKRAIFGSTASDVLRNTTTPVLLVTER